MQSNGPDEIFFDGDIYESQFAYIFQAPDTPFWIDLARNFGPKVLKLACGTGRITIPAYESGIDIDGLDFSESMLRVARKRAKAKSLPIKFFHADIRALEFQDAYDLLFLPTATISHLIARPDVERFLAGARKALRRNGILALDMHNPMKTFLRTWPLEPAPAQSSFEHTVTKEKVEVTTTLEYSTDTQIFTVKYHYTFPNGSTRDGAVVIKLYFPMELQTLLHYNGFEVWRSYGNYKQEPFTSESERYVLLTRVRT